MTRKPLISGNWKMNLNHFEAIQLVQKLSYALTKDDIEVCLLYTSPSPRDRG